MARTPVENPATTCENRSNSDTIGAQMKTAPAGARTPNRSLATADPWEDKTVTTYDSSGTHAPTAPLDGCPNCLRRNNHPTAVRPDGDPTFPGVYADYRCGHCAHTWTTGWAVD